MPRLICLTSHVTVMCAQFIQTPWSNVVEGDHYYIYIQDMTNHLASDVVSDVNANFYYLPKVNQLPQGEVPMFGRVVRAISLLESRSITQTILIKLTNPGGRDQEVTKKWHSGLNMSIEDFPPGSTIDNAAGGLVCLITKYLYCRKNDIITVKYDGIAVEHVVSPKEAAEPGPIKVLISEDIILQGNQGGRVEVAYTVKDVVGKVPEGDWVHSKPYILNTELDPTLLTAPLFLVDGEESTSLDLDLQSRSTLQVLCLPPLRRPKPNPLNQLTVVITFSRKVGQAQSCD